MIGIDEVGRGCWAGPLLVVAARQTGDLPYGLDDSKKLSKKQRLALLAGIASSCQLGEGWAQPQEIDQLGLTAAMRLAVSRALTAIDAQDSEEIIMDGSINYCDTQYQNVTCVVAADSAYPIVSAASIHAKVTRDQAMTDLALQCQGYGFESHVGYGTKAHLEALKVLGVSSHHRKSYKPIQALL
ncbi:MAG: ribonuclease [Patescibacteria group bacterium]|nr:ribonuclease [Patescibacteria group bacterium]